jgi:hypothetical protein
VQVTVAAELRVVFNNRGGMDGGSHGFGRKFVAGLRFLSG